MPVFWLVVIALAAFGGEQVEMLNANLEEGMKNKSATI